MAMPFAPSSVLAPSSKLSVQEYTVAHVGGTLLRSELCASARNVLVGRANRLTSSQHNQLAILSVKRETVDPMSLAGRSKPYVSATCGPMRGPLSLA